MSKTIFSTELKKDIDNFKIKVKPELEYLISKYEPSDVKLEFIKQSGMTSCIGVQLIFK